MAVLFRFRSTKWLIAFMSAKVCSALYEVVPFEILDENPPSKEQLEARTWRQGYWDKGDIQPVMAESSRLLCRRPSGFRHVGIDHRPTENKKGHRANEDGFIA